jgi:flavin reductase (DIM6/NTAB) family NADH-FMN oxidoreductase RutF
VTTLAARDRFAPGSICADDFKDAFRNHASGVAVITADAGRGPVGLTASSVASVSVDPPMFVFSVSELSSSTPTILASETVVLHLLGADQLEIAKLCSTSGVDRFADTTLWSRLETGEPYFVAARSRILARIVERVAAGGSTVVVAEALRADVPAPDDPRGRRDGGPLVYHNRAWHVLGDHSRMSS